MKSITALTLIVMCAVGLIRAGELSANYESAESAPECQWVDYIFENTNLQRVDHPPEELDVLRLQMEQMDLDGNRIIVGRSYAVWAIMDDFQKAAENNPVSNEVLTSRERHGEYVETKMYRVSDRGVLVVFFHPYIIFADLGPYDESVNIKKRMMGMNR